MIRITRINDARMVVNADLIEFIESIPDTMLTLTTGKKIMVKESIEEIIERVAEFRRVSAGRELNPAVDSPSNRS